MAFNAAQWQAYASKNQLVLGPNGGQGVISVEDFGQVSTIKIPDPGQSTTDFILANVAAGTQTINGNLTVTGTFTPSGGSGGEVLLNGNLVFNNAADRSILFNAAKTGTGAALSVLGNESSDAVGGAVSVTSGTGVTASGALSLNSGAASGGGSGAVTLASGTATTSSGAVTVKSGTGASTGNLTLQTSDSTGTIAGGITVVAGTSAVGAGPAVTISAGNGSTTGGNVDITGGGGGSGKAGQVSLQVKTGTPNGTIEIGSSASGSAAPASITVGQVGMTGATTLFAQRSPIVPIAGLKTVTVGESGTVFSVSAASSYTITLPAAAAGLRYIFLLTTGGGNVVNIKTAGADGTMKGMTVTNNGTVAVTSVAGGTANTALYAAGAVVSDRWDIICADGTNWMANGTSGAHVGVAFA